MAVRNVELSEELDQFVMRSVETGRFQDANAVVREALLAFQDREKEDEIKLKALIEAIEEGDASGVYEGDVFADLRVKYGLPPRT